MRNEPAHRINILKEVGKPKALLFLLSLFYFLFVLSGSGQVSVHWGDSAVMTLAALVLWFSRPWSYVLSALLAALIVYQLVFGFPLASAGEWWTWLLALRWADIGFIGLAGIVFCYAVACFLLGLSSHKQPHLS
jgi:hypothetical protein